MAFQAVGGRWTKEALNRLTFNKSGVGGVIGGVTAANYLGSIGTIKTAGNFRADRQNLSSTHANVQIQVNGISGEKSSVGGALIPLSLGKNFGPTATATEKKTAQARATELTKVIQGALTRSVGSWRYVKGKPGHGEYQTFEVKGTFSS